MTASELSKTASSNNDSTSATSLRARRLKGTHSLSSSFNNAALSASSSTAFPSSAARTPHSSLPGNSTPPTCMAEDDLVECAQNQTEGDAKHLSVHRDVSNVLAVCASAPILKSMLLPPLASNTVTSSTHSQSGDSLSHTSSTSCSDIYRRAKGRPYALVTPEAQTQFSRELHKLLLGVLQEQSRYKQASCSSMSITHSQGTTGSSCSISSTSSSVYAADISLDHSAARSSALSSSASTHLSRSSSAASSTISRPASASRMDDSDDSPEGLEFANTPMAAHFVYGSISDEAEDADITLVEAELDDGEVRTLLVSEDVVEDLVRPSTPSPTRILATPAAPKKNQAHFFMEGSSAIVSRKRPRIMSFSDGPQQDRPVSSGYMRTQSTSSTPSSRGAVETPPDSLPALQEETSESPMTSKRARLTSEAPCSSSSDHPRTNLLAKEPASFRRAASLRSEPSTKLLSIAELKKKPVVATIVYPKISPDAAPDDELDTTEYPPTQPVTPIARSPARSLVTGSPFPVLCPSALGPPPVPPATDADAAEARLLSLIRRELAAKVSDGLLAAEKDKGDMSVDPPVVDSDQEMWTALGEFVSNGKVKTSKGGKRQGRSQDQPPTPSPPEPRLSLGIEEDFRARVVEWILDVKPPTFPSKPSKCANLRAQLTESPNTRWHAAHLFTRYFLRLGPSPLSSPIAEPTADDKGHRVLQGREALTWDVAVGCISLAVKFHRDFLHPLYPALAKDYLILAPHTMEYDDLESAHRDILSAMDYCIGSYTPGAYIEELLAAVPSIRPFVDERGDWDFARTETWEILFDSLVDITYMRHSVYVLTGCALVLGIVESIVYSKKTEVAFRSKYSSEAASKRRRGMKCECEKLRAKAFKAVFGIEQDIRSVLGASESSWTRCMDWLKAMTADA